MNTAELLEKFGYISSPRDEALAKIWTLIGDNYKICKVPQEGVLGNVVVIPDDIYWECDKVIKKDLITQSYFKQKWVTYRPVLFAKEHQLVTKGSLVYNQSWYDKMNTGEVQIMNEKKKIMGKIIDNRAKKEEIEEVCWNGKDLEDIGVFGIYYKDKLLEVLVEFDSIKDRIKEEFKKHDLASFSKYDSKKCDGRIILSVWDLIKESGVQLWSENDVLKTYKAIRFAMKPEFLGKRNITFNFGGEVNFDDSIVNDMENVGI